jgi:hypothetical protein
MITITFPKGWNLMKCLKWSSTRGLSYVGGTEDVENQELTIRFCIISED